MIFLWMIIGVIAISIAFFFPPQSIEVWPSIDTAGIVAAIYLFILLLFVLRSPIPVKHRVIVGVISFVCCIALLMQWTGMKSTTLWQQQRLQEIHSVIGRGVIEGECPQRLLTVLEKYYHQQKGKKATLGQVFLQIFPDAVVGSNIHELFYAQDSLRLFVTALSDSMITLTASHAFIQGKNSTFLPYWGRKGTLQERYILTTKGVRHESDN